MKKSTATIDVGANAGRSIAIIGGGIGGLTAALAFARQCAQVTVHEQARAIAEVGAVMIVGGNIEGVTRVMTTAIALETSKGDLPLALALGLVLLGVVGALNALAALVRWRGRRVVTPQGVR